MTRSMWATSALALTALLALPSQSQAQRYGMGVGGAPRGGVYFGSGPGYYGPGGNYGSGAYYRPGYDGGYNNGGFYRGPAYAPNAWNNAGQTWYPNSYYNSETYQPAPNYTLSNQPANASQSYYYGPNSPTTSTDPSVAHVRVQVPTAAEVWFDGQATKQQGAERVFVSPSLKSDTAYLYEIQARWMDNGKPVTSTKSVRVQAGKWATVDFNNAAADAAPRAKDPARRTPPADDMP